jgi:NHLM bacteriocin system ABC transporter peptidase/ATP-binding protein
VRTPTVLQMEAVECGAASLAMVLAYYGRHVPLEELRVACGVSRDGSNALNLARAARQYGLEAKAYKREMDRLRTTRFPAIIFWNFNHFLVVDGVEGDGFRVNDPAIGRRVVSGDEMDAAFTGVVIELTPGPTFTKGGAPPSLFESLRARLRGSERAVLFALLAGLALVVPGLVVPTFAKMFIDQVVVGKLGYWLRPLLLGMVVTALLRAGLVWLQQYYLLRLETKLSVTTSSRFLWHVLRLPVEFYAQRYAGEISWRAGLNDEVAQFLSRRLASAAIDAMMIVFFGVLMLTYDVWLTLVALAAVGVLAAATRYVSRLRIEGNMRVLQEEGKATGTLMAGLSAIETLKASAMESDFFARWAGQQAKYLSASQSIARTTALFLVVPPLTIAITNAVVLLLGVQRVIQGDFTIGTLVAFQSLLASFIGPVNNFVSLAGAVQEMHGKMARIDDALRYPADVGDGAASSSGDVERLNGHLELRDITFGYSRNAEPLLRDFSLLLPPGSRVALVGPSGCGKSTVTRLITCLYPPWSGEVLLAGKPATEWSRATRAASVAMVDQDISLFAGTVRDNLTLWDATVPSDAIITACKDACIHDDIMERPGGLDAVVEEGGANFSGGQRQRLEIARALVTNPSVLVLDEATSALDAVTEHQIDRNLRRRGCTCVIVAHRLSTVRDADEIIVLDRGRVVQRGTHESLMADEQGLYHTLAAEL